MTLEIGFPLVFTLLVLIVISNVDIADAARGGGPGGGRGLGGVGTVFDITKLGAQFNGDATQGIMSAWKQACAAAGPCEVLIPAGEYTLGPVLLEGPCKSPITLNVNGNFKAPTVDKFGKVDTWVRFSRVVGLTVKGGGVFDGQGTIDRSKNTCLHSRRCSMPPFNFRFDFINESTITGITSKDSKTFHLNLMGCNRVNINQMTIIAPTESPNTDGIHVGRSDTVNITDTKIGTGTDCISIADGTKNLHVEKVTCGPGHGISIGGIGGAPNESPVVGITVKSCNFTGTDNGILIRTWMDSYENTVSNILFEDITLDKVWYPIVVDQEHCPANHCKTRKPSKVKISGIKIRNVRGTTTRTEAVTLTCSNATPCEKIELSDVDIKYVGNISGTAQFICRNYKPVTRGVMIPPPCNAQDTPDAAT